MQKQHALKLEDLEMNTEKANKIVEVLRDFLSDVGFRDERIDSLECRSRDGFSPYGHNKGGLEAIAFRDQYSCQSETTGFENTDETLERYQKMNEEWFLKDKGLESLDYENEALLSEFDEYCMSGDDTVLFGIDLMLTDENTLNIRATSSCKDSPYHRQYDDLFDYNVEFKNITQLRAKLKKLLKHEFILTMKRNVREAF